MILSQSQKDARDKWDRQNMTHIGCRLTKERANQFREACAKLNTVPNRVFLKAIAETIMAARELEDQEKS